jgi:hypothetical protein
MRTVLLLATTAVAALSGLVGAETSGSQGVRFAELAIVSSDPLVVRGTGFRPAERVKLLVTAAGLRGTGGAARASRAGSFAVRLLVAASPREAVVVQAFGTRGTFATAQISVTTRTLGPPP